MSSLFLRMDSPISEAQIERSLNADVVHIPQWKRMLDVTLILISLPLLLPIMVFIALLIWFVSKGPILFKQERVGYLGRRFSCFKFRTMVVGADTTIHQGHLSQLMGSDLPMVKMDAHGDPRLIPFGLLLRSAGLDELPQIINILREEMSLVGPRPCLDYEYDKYLPSQRERFKTLPGLTGLWQVNGKNRTTFVQMVQLDIEYARNKSLWLDSKIILKTIPALISQAHDMRKRRRLSTSPAPKAVIQARGVTQYSLPKNSFHRSP